jgi:hypothetical protein
MMLKMMKKIIVNDITSSVSKHIAGEISATTGPFWPNPSSMDSPGSAAGYKALFRDSCS